MYQYDDETSKEEAQEAIHGDSLVNDVTYIVTARDSEGNIVGYGTLNDDEVDLLYTLEEHQGKGIASEILKRLEEHALAEGYDEVHLSPWGDDEEGTKKLASFYNKRGYDWDPEDPEDERYHMYKPLIKHKNIIEAVSRRF